jgi:hypothetical protein
MTERQIRNYIVTYFWPLLGLILIVREVRKQRKKK